MDWWITFDQQAADYLPDLRIEKEEPMDRHTSFRIGGPARRMAFPERGEQLVLLLDMAARCGARPLVMGNGTNLLAPDEGLDRLVIDTSAGLSRVEAGGTPGTILAEAGASLARAQHSFCTGRRHSSFLASKEKDMGGSPPTLGNCGAHFCSSIW